MWPHRAGAASTMRHTGRVYVPVPAAGAALRPPQGAAQLPPARDAVSALRAPHEPCLCLREAHHAVGAVQPRSGALRAYMWQAACLWPAPLRTRVPLARRRLPTLYTQVWTAAPAVWPRLPPAVPCTGAVPGERAVHCGGGAQVRMWPPRKDGCVWRRRRWRGPCRFAPARVHRGMPHGAAQRSCRQRAGPRCAAGRGSHRRAVQRCARALRRLGPAHRPGGPGRAV